MKSKELSRGRLAIEEVLLQRHGLLSLPAGYQKYKEARQAKMPSIKQYWTNNEILLQS